MRSCIIAFLSVFFLSGCAGFELRGPQTPEGKAGVIRALATTATVSGLSAGFDDDERDKQAAVAGVILDWVVVVQGALNDGVSWEALTRTFDAASPDDRGWPPEVRAGITSAISILNIYVRPLDVTSALSPEHTLYFQAFLSGIIEGATPFVGGP